MLDPYVADEKHGDQFTGNLLHEPEQLKADVVALDAQGLTVKIHATGDRALRVALDAFAAAREANGDSGLHHEVSHAELMHPDDLPRFESLNVTAEMCPVLWYPSPLVAAMEPVIGTERTERFWPVKSLYESGALVIYGSDWPSVALDPSPWPGIEAMITRRDPYGVTGGEMGPNQAVDLETALTILTRNGAVAAKLGDATGSIEVGKAADFIVLDRNLFEIPVEDIGDTQVLLTVVEGKTVYEKN
jgi:predicted amidohydrolase YtcJ